MAQHCFDHGHNAVTPVCCWCGIGPVRMKQFPGHGPFSIDYYNDGSNHGEECSMRPEEAQGGSSANA
jgi:hypothetical protein